jgi:myo-inositol-1(or 4)-monophosphatase
MNQEIENVARAVAESAGEMIRLHIGQVADSDIHSKGPSDYVTEVDQAIENRIIETIRAHFPDHHIMSEETANDGLQSGVTWVIDPLDGTTNFIHGFPFVAVSVAVCVDKRPVLGVVLDPVREELFFARKGDGAYLNGRRIRARNRARLDEALVATGFPSRSKNVLEPFLDTFRAVFNRVSGIRRAGAAALDLAYLAAGRLDGFWEVGLKAWDVAAGALLVAEAGAAVTDFWGEERYLYNGHIVGGTLSVYPFLLEQVQRFLVPVLEAGD